MAKWKIFFLVLRLQSRALWVSQAQRPFWFPFLIGRTAVSMTFCEFQRAEQLLIKDAHAGTIVSNSLVTQWTQNGLPFLLPGDLPDPGIEPKSPVLAGGFFTTALIRRPPKTLHKTGSCHNPILLELCRGKKNTTLLLPWSLAYIPSRRYNLSLLTREGA